MSVGELDGIELVDDPGIAEVVLLGGPDESWTYRRMNAVFRALLGGVPLVAMQQNRWWPTADGPALDAGMFVVGLSYAAATEPVVVGKPSTEIYRSACRLLGVDPAEAMMVGDDPDSDLAPAAGSACAPAWFAPARARRSAPRRRPRSGRPGGVAGGVGVNRQGCRLLVPG